MEESLLAKQQQERPSFTDAEISWLLEHLGDPAGAIRDRLVYSTFARGIADELFSQQHYRQLVTYSQRHDLIHTQMAQALPHTLTRSFAALLNASLIAADGKRHSLYYQQMTLSERTYFFDCALDYVVLEHDMTGYHPQYHWVHGLAHGADFMTQALAHPDFPAARATEALHVLLEKMKRLPASFTAGEERRFAVPVAAAIQTQKITPAELAAWLDAIAFPTDSDTGQLLDYDRFRCFENFLTAIYFQLEQRQLLTEPLKASLMNWLQFY